MAKPSNTNTKTAPSYSNRVAKALIVRGTRGGGIHGYNKSKAGRSKNACRGKVSY